MTADQPGPSCVLCGEPATETIEPSRRTLARGLDPDDASYSVTVILPDIALCVEHAVRVLHGERRVGWCDDPRCRSYGELDGPSSCGEPYQTLSPGKRT